MTDTGNSPTGRLGRNEPDAQDLARPKTLLDLCAVHEHEKCPGKFKRGAINSICICLCHD